jgi:hypothetical protein
VFGKGSLHNVITDATSQRIPELVCTNAGAIAGISIAALTAVVEAQELDLGTYLQRINEGLTQLEKGLAP